MLHSIGRKVRAADAIDAMLDCHAKIRHHASLIAKVSSGAEFSDDEVVSALGFVLRYFEDSLPAHAMDEDLSLTPRLRGRDRALDSALSQMREEHLAHGPLLFRALSACREIMQDPTRRMVVAPLLAPLSASLSEHFDQHLALEERDIFPRARLLLSESELLEIAAEMQSRRRTRLL